MPRPCALVTLPVAIRHPHGLLTSCCRPLSYSDGWESRRGDHASPIRMGYRVPQAPRKTATASAQCGMSHLPSDGPPALQQGRPAAFARSRPRLLACGLGGEPAQHRQQGLDVAQESGSEVVNDIGAPVMPQSVTNMPPSQLVSPQPNMPTVMPARPGNMPGGMPLARQMPPQMAQPLQRRTLDPLT